MDPLLEQFLSEARENLAFIDQNIGEIGGEDPELLNSIFRAAHTLKGGSGIVGFESVKNITHHAEDLLDMLRSGKLEFQDSMTDALYDAFDEVMNLIEAAEESGDIVEADEKIVDRIVAELKEQMGKSSESEDEAWQVPFNLVSDKSSIINISMKTLRGVDSIKIPFQNAPLNQDFCENENFYAVVFDVDDSCMVYGNDPIYALTLLDEKVVGIFSCMSEEDAKAVLSGTEDEDGLLLKSHIIAFVYARYEDIEDSLFNFIDELELLPLDINTLLTISTGDTGHKIDSLKELSNIAEDFDLSTIKDEVQNSMELIGVNTIQYAQLQRFLDIAGLIDDKDTTKLKAFFENIYKGEVYFPVEVLDDIKSDDSTDTSMEDNCNVEVEDEIDEDNIVKTEIELTESIQKTITNIYEQQYRALEYVDNEEDALLRVISILNKTKKFARTKF
jgi:two-component system chemotaxis sensor kinase CheA